MTARSACLDALEQRAVVSGSRPGLERVEVVE
jgi:hypothetical protein